ncbi:recombinase family protein [bacterium]|nr:recombinase family protein [bacterium]
MRLAFSYQRVSSIEQVQGVGLARQEDLFEPFCKRHGLIPNKDRVIDEGLSAYHGLHYRKGNLVGFLQARRDGFIPAGSVLVVEEWDRFSRRAASVSERMLHEMWEQDLALGIVSQNQIITEDSYNSDPGQSITLKVLQIQANENSAVKSRRIKDVWQKRWDNYRLKGEKFLSMSDAPKWLVIEDGDFVPGPHTSTIQLIFDLTVDQGLSSVGVAKELNKRGLKTPSGATWTNANVSKVIKNDQVIGRKSWPDGQTSDGYFPVIVDPKKVKRARAMAEWRKFNPALGRTTTAQGGLLGPCNNIFKGITFCQCGAAMTDTTSHSGKYLDLVCSAQNSGRNCTVPTRQCWKVDEELLLEAFMLLRWERFFKNPATGSRIRELEARLLEEERAAAGYRTTAENSLANLEAVMGQKDADIEMVKMLSEYVSKGQKQAKEAEQQAQQTRAEIEALKSQPNGDYRQKQIREKAQAFMAQQNRADREVRNAFNDWVKTTGARIIFMSTQPLRVRFTCSDLLPTDFRWLPSSITEEQLKNTLEEFYVFRRGDEIVMDQAITNMARLGFDPELIAALRQEKEASIPVPKRIPSPVWQPAALTKRQQQMQQQQ